MQANARPIQATLWCPVFTVTAIWAQDLETQRLLCQHLDLSAPVGEVERTKSGKAFITATVAPPSPGTRHNASHSWANRTCSTTTDGRELPVSVQTDIQQLMDYLDPRSAHTTPLTIAVHWPAQTVFQRAVMTALQRVPFGATWSYQQLAEAAGYPHAYRAVGSVLARNPFPIIYPCHRILPKQHGYGQYSGFGGTETKRWLLAQEAATLDQVGQATPKTREA